MTSVLQRLSIRLVLVALILSLFASHIPQSEQAVHAQGDDPVSPPAYEITDASIAQEWMMLTYSLVRDGALGPTEGSRIYAYMGIALYEGISPGMPSNYFSLGGTIQDLPLLPYPDPDPTIETYDWISSANASMATVAAGLFAESNNEEALAQIQTLRDANEAERIEAVGADVVERSMAFGDQVGEALLEWIATDNYGPAKKQAEDFEPVSGEDYMWVPTNPTLRPVGPYWGEVRTVGLPYAEACSIPMRMEYSTDPDSTFYKQAKEVLDVGDNLTEEQREIARFWIDTPGETGTPGGHWVMIGVQLVDQLELSLGRTAEMFVLLNSALMDSFIATWAQKYQVNLLRPETYIQRNLRRNWAPYLATPQFPEYPSGHSVTSAAAAEVLTTMFGQVAFIDRTPILNGHEQLERSFTSFYAAANEAAISRMYGGIHFRAAIENGLKSGTCIGQYVLNNVRLRSVPQGE